MKPFFWIAAALCLNGELARAETPVVKPTGTPADCLLDELNTISADLGNAYQMIQLIRPGLISGKETPAWKDLDDLQKIVAAVRAGKKSAAENHKLDELQNAIADIQKAVSSHPAWLPIRDASLGAKVDPNYKPGEFALKAEFQTLLYALDRELPPGLRIRGVHLPFDGRAPGLIVKAKELLARQEKRFEAQLPNTGFASVDALRGALVAFSPVSKGLAEQFDSKQVEFAMNRPEGARWWVPRVGFQNQRITGSSRGMMNPDFRNNVEAKMTGTELEEYKTFDDQLKPNYGYLKPVPQADVHQSTAAQHYGDDVYIFNEDRVDNRLTWTAGDSFGPAGDAPDSPDQPLKSWRGMFIPWKYRLFAIPDLLQNAVVKMEFQAEPPQPATFVDELKPGAKAASSSLPRTMPVPPPGPTPPVYPAYPTPPAAASFPPIPAPPPGPKLIPEPVAPPSPVQPQPKKLPMMPRPKDGETFEAAKARFFTSDEYVRVQNENAKAQADYLEKLADYQKSDAYLKYHDEALAVGQKNQDLITAFNDSPEMKDYEVKREAWQAEISRINLEYQKSDAYIKFTAEIAKYLEEVQRIQKEWSDAYAKYTSSDAYKAYEVAYGEFLTAGVPGPPGVAPPPNPILQWMEYRCQENPYFCFVDSPLAPFTGPVERGYIELQFWGPTNLDDVKIFEFRKTPPSGEFLEALLKRGIKIRDGRNDPAVEWKPDASDSAGKTP